MYSSYCNLTFVTQSYLFQFFRQQVGDMVHLAHVLTVSVVCLQKLNGALLQHVDDHSQVLGTSYTGQGTWQVWEERKREQRDVTWLFQAQWKL